MASEPEKVGPRARARSAAEWFPWQDLKRWKANPRKKQPVRKVARSIQRLGWGSVILARKDSRELVAGDTRIQAVPVLLELYGAATEAELADSSLWHPEAVEICRTGLVPVRFGEWTDDQARALALADNKLGEEAEWDQQGVDRILADMKVGQVDLTGFELGSIDHLGEDGESEEEQSGESVLGGLEYRVVITCADEAQQAELLARFEEEGLECRPLIS